MNSLLYVYLAFFLAAKAVLTTAFYRLLVGRRFKLTALPIGGLAGAAFGSWLVLRGLAGGL